MARTRWEDWYAEVDRAFDELRAKCDEMFVMGLSMGGCLALRLAELRGPAIRGLVVVNPSITADTNLIFLAPMLKLVIPSLKGIASDIKKPGAKEAGYDRVPVKAAATLPGLWRITRQHLSELQQPVLAYRSASDHVVGPASMKLLQDALPATQLEVHELADSYHVATLDNDAEVIFSGSLEFIRLHSGITSETTGGE
jgi:carboxylesterase